MYSRSLNFGRLACHFKFKTKCVCRKAQLWEVVSFQDVLDPPGTSRMNFLSLHSQLQRGCNDLGLPVGVMAELISYVALQRTHPTSWRQYNPSAKVDELLHWILLNTDARLDVEQCVGTIQHSTTTANIDEDIKCQRRCASHAVRPLNFWDCWQA